MMIFHFLGANIPHHNRRVLQFFECELLPHLKLEQHHFYVVGDCQLQVEFPKLNVVALPTKRAAAMRLIADFRRSAAACCLLHGQFNGWIWIAILLGLLPVNRCIWHIWGADWYEQSRRWTFRLFYPIRRLAQQKLPEIWATLGDLAAVKERFPRRIGRDKVVYFPTKMGGGLKIEHSHIASVQCDEQYLSNRPFTVLLGNSGDPTNLHLEAFSQIYQCLGSAVRIIVPMGYPANNTAYIAQVEAEARRFFSVEQVVVLDQAVSFGQYFALLKQCDVGYFNFKRQQGVGTICLLLSQQIPVVLNDQNPFRLDLQATGVPFLVADMLSKAAVEKVKTILHQQDLIALPFFPERYRQRWTALLVELECQKNME